MNKRQLYNITENVVKRLIKEGLLTDDEMNNEVSPEFEEELIDFCRENDFLYIINGKLRAANSSEIQSEIINDIRTSPYLRFTNKYDSLLSNKVGRDAKVIELKDNDGYVYSVVYER